MDRGAIASQGRTEIAGNTGRTASSVKQFLDIRISYQTVTLRRCTALYGCVSQMVRSKNSLWSLTIGAFSESHHVVPPCKDILYTFDSKFPQSLSYLGTQKQKQDVALQLASFGCRITF